MIKNILVPLDGSENSELALTEAIQYAKAFNATIQVVSVATDQRYVQFGVRLGQDVMDVFEKRAKEILAAAKTKLDDEGVKSQTQFVIGVPKVQIADKLPAKLDTQLIVMGKSGVNGISRALLGSTTEYVVRHAKASVLVIGESDN